MRASRLLVVYLLVTLCGCGCGQTNLQKTVGHLSMTPKSLDFGTACLGETSEQQIVLENQGNATINITKTTVTGSAFALLEPLPATIEPNDQVLVRIGFTPTTADEFSGAFQIVTDADEDGTQRATLIGSGFSGARQDFEVACESTPGSGKFDTDCRFLSFDHVPAGQHLDRVARVQNKGCAIVNVNEMDFYPGPSDASSGADVQLFSLPNDKAPFALHGGQTKDVTVRFSAPQVASQPDVRLKFVSDDPAKKDPSWDAGVWDLGMFADSVAPALLVDTDIITFFDAQTGQPDAKTFTVSNTGNAPLTNVTVKVTEDNGAHDYVIDQPGPFTLTETGTSGDSKTITVTFTPAAAGSSSGKVVVSAGSDSHTIRLVGGTEPQLVVKWLDNNNEADPPVDFGQTDTGAKGIVRTVRIENAGQAPLHVTEVSIPAADNPAGSYVLGPFTAGAVGPSTHMDVNVTFNDAVSLRNDSAKLRIVSDDPAYTTNNGAYEVDLVSTNEPNFKPVPCIKVCAHATGSTSCTTAPQLGLELTLDGSCSTGPEATDTLSYKWELPVKAQGSAATLDTPTASATRLVSPGSSKPDVAGSYVVKLTVTDQFGQSNFVSQTINVSR